VWETGEHKLTEGLTLSSVSSCTRLWGRAMAKNFFTEYDGRKIDHKMYFSEFYDI